MVCPSHRVVGRVNELLSVECLLHCLPVMKAQYLVVISVCITRVNENSCSQRAEEFDFPVPGCLMHQRGPLVRNPGQRHKLLLSRVFQAVMGQTRHEQGH